jgi:hypothetical protein
MTMTVGWLVYQIAPPEELIVLGLYETKEAAQEDAKLADGDWEIKSVPFLGWGHPRDLN